MKQFLDRVLAVIQLEPLAYLEIKENKAPLTQAMFLLFLSSTATALGSVEGYVEKIPMAILTACAAWIAWGLLIYVLGTRIFRTPETQVDLITVMRLVGFASAPGILKALAFIPAVSGIILFGTSIWILGTTTIASQQALSYKSFPRALGVTLMSWLVYQFLLFQI
ncbi:MAG: hypothetical protein VST69_05170 [Nitrospirota bacterium]|nr:hypothetical protein [Nitrospirota bacterium]